MKPRIIERFEKYEDTLEDTVKRLIQEVVGTTVKGGAELLVGTIIPFAGDMEGPHPIDATTRKPDKGYALCNGATYFSSSLGGMIETPDLRDCFILGCGERFLAGQKGGSYESSLAVTISPTTLTLDQLPPHTHAIPHATIVEFGRSRDVALYKATSDPITRYTYTTSNGNGKPHTHHASLTADKDDNLPPYVALYYLMKI